MHIRVGYELQYEFPQPTPIIANLNVHYSRASDIVQPDQMRTMPHVPITAYRDGFGNWCTRLVAPTGLFTITADGIVADSGTVDPVVIGAVQHPLFELPEDTLVFLLGSRYCETDRMTEAAWRMFSGTPLGWARVQAICNFVHQHIAFGYEHASPTKTAWDVFNDRKGVCRDYAHLVVALLRALDVPARVVAVYAPGLYPMDFHAVAEAAVDGCWRVVDATLLAPRSTMLRIATGRDAADTAFLSSYGGSLTLLGSAVNAIVDGYLPDDDVKQLVTLS